MDKRRELKQIYKDMEIPAGVYQIRNTMNGKALVTSTSDLKTMNGRRLELEIGAFKNRALQKEWNEFGKDAFEFQVLETLEEKEGESQEDALKQLEKKWIEKLQPFGERGYNPPPRQV